MEPRDDEKNVMLNMLAGIGIGALVGAVAGLLLAPRAGTETRRELGTRLNDLGDRLTELGDEMGDKMRTAGEQLGTRVRSAVDAGRRAATERLDHERNEAPRAAGDDARRPAAGA